MTHLLFAELLKLNPFVISFDAADSLESELLIEPDGLSSGRTFNEIAQNPRRRSNPMTRSRSAPATPWPRWAGVMAIESASARVWPETR